MSRPKFYVGLVIVDGDVVGHGVSSKPTPFTAQPLDGPAKDPRQGTPARPPNSTQDFPAVFSSLVKVLDLYRKFVPLTLGIARPITTLIASRDLSTFTKNHGTKRPDLSLNENVDVYEMDESLYGEFRDRQQRLFAAWAGAELLPEVMLLGLISAFDGFLASLLKAVINKHEEIVLTSQKQLTFKELSAFSSIEEARTTIIEREVEAVIRKSHHDQFDWMQTHLNVELKKGLSVWPSFIEICERRNLLTHTGGLVSDQYIKICRENKCNIAGVRAGDKLAVDTDYFSEAVRVVSEISLKLAYVLWRKFDEKNKQVADATFNEQCMNLIADRSYKLAEALLLFSHKVHGLTDSVRRMMVVNLANAMRLQGRVDDARKVLDAEDWSAANDDFQMCVAAVREDTEKIFELMESLGKRFDADNYRTWPVFHRIRRDPRFIEKFEAIFGEPFVVIKPDTRSSGKEFERIVLSNDSEPDNTLH